jgi:hypothetical protein
MTQATPTTTDVRRLALDDSDVDAEQQPAPTEFGG